MLKGTRASEETKRRMSIAHLGKEVNKTQNESNVQWKGNQVSYQALHMWINRKLGKARHCSKIASHNTYPYITKYVWANISGEYKRELSDWRSLCRSCNLLDRISRARVFDKKGHRIKSEA